MEWILVAFAIILAINFSTSDRMKALRFRYAYITFFVLYPVFFYLVVLHDFSLIKLILFLIMLASSLYDHFTQKARLAANEVQRPA